jgi:hypothetical protein
MTRAVLNVSDIQSEALSGLLERYGLELKQVADNEDIPGSFWGDSEAGLVGNCVYVRPDTPIHSLLHETCHYICMDTDRRSTLDTDAGGDYDEENGVCYLQIILADEIPAMGQSTMMRDMDRWGYTFRLGSSKKWFEEDAEDARNWLLKHHIIEKDNKPTFLLRS